MATDRQQALADLETLGQHEHLVGVAEQRTAWKRLRAFLVESVPDPAETERLERELARLRADRDAIKGYADHRSRFADWVWAELAEAREALRLGVEAMERHDQWCGHKRDSPGDGIWHRFEDAARAALTGSEQPTLREPDETAGLQRSTREARPNQPGSPSGSPSAPLYGRNQYGPDRYGPVHGTPLEPRHGAIS
jgi:hypothetical protein